MSISVPRSTQNEEGLLDLILTLTVTLLSLLLNSEKIICNVGMSQIFHQYLSPWILFLLVFLISPSSKSWKSYTIIKGIKAWFSITSAVQLPEPTASEFVPHIRTTTALVQTSTYATLLYTHPHQKLRNSSQGRQLYSGQSSQLICS